MIEVVAKLGRGPVFLAGEMLECVITFTNPLSAASTSASRYGRRHRALLHAQPYRGSTSTELTGVPGGAVGLRCQLSRRSLPHPRCSLMVLRAISISGRKLR